MKVSLSIQHRLAFSEYFGFTKSYQNSYITILLTSIVDRPKKHVYALVFVCQQNTYYFAYYLILLSQQIISERKFAVCQSDFDTKWFFLFSVVKSFLWFYQKLHYSSTKSNLFQNHFLRFS